MSAEGDLRISLLPTGKVVSTTQMVADDVDPNAQSGYTTHNYDMDDLAVALFNAFIYATTPAVLNTTSKIPVGAINEITPSIGVQLKGILEAGETSVTLTNSQITSSSRVDYWGKVSPTTITFSTGSITLTFDEQEEDIAFTVEVA